MMMMMMMLAVGCGQTYHVFFSRDYCGCHGLRLSENVFKVDEISSYGALRNTLYGLATCDFR